MNLATSSGDNHLRAVVLSLIASHFLHTSYDYAEQMLKSSDSLAASLGSQPKSSSKKQDVPNTPTKGGGHTPTSKMQQQQPNVAVANAHLRMWIGERFLGGFRCFVFFFCLSADVEQSCTIGTRIKKLRECRL